MDNKQQTAVEWLEKQTRKPEWHSLKRGDIFEQAKEMHKQEIINSFFEGAYGGDNISGEQYYNETYGGGNK